jgi:hypothetical protein
MTSVVFDPGDATETLDLDAFLLEVSSTVDFSDDDSVTASVPLLHALARDRTVLTTWITDRLRRPTGLDGLGFSGQSLGLAVRDDFAVRANIWIPVDASSPVAAYDTDYASYGLPHDHDFSFLTVGYSGPGYRTELYEYDPMTVIGFCGEPVALERQPDVQLSAGTAMFYRESVDVHVQHPPSDVSVSLNLLVGPRKRLLHSQLIFDLDQQRVSRLVTAFTNSGRSICQLAGDHGDESCVGPLEALLLDDEIRAVTRLEAAIALGRLVPDRATTYLKDLYDRSTDAYLRHELTQRFGEARR